MSPRVMVNTDRDLVAVNNGIFDYKSKTVAIRMDRLRESLPLITKKTQSTVIHNLMLTKYRLGHPESWMRISA